MRIIGALALKETPGESQATETSPRPFALRFAERTTGLRLVRREGQEVFDDPTTVDTTGQHEDPHTDEG